MVELTREEVAVIIRALQNFVENLRGYEDDQADLAESALAKFEGRNAE